MATLFDGTVEVHYSIFHVMSRWDMPLSSAASFRGQTNGLCGAGWPGSLDFCTGLHTGPVPLTVELHDTAPTPRGDRWEDIVEVSFTPVSGQVLLDDFDNSLRRPLALPQRHYRVRYCANGMDAAAAQDTRMDDDPVLDRYLVQFWPAQPAVDRIVTQTSQRARRSHADLSLLPPITPQDEAAAQHPVLLAPQRRTPPVARPSSATRASSGRRPQPGVGTPSIRATRKDTGPTDQTD